MFINHANQSALSRKTIMLRRAVLMLCISSICFLAGTEAEANDYVIATGIQGGAYFPVGNEIVREVNVSKPKFSLRAIPTNGGVANMELLRTGKAQLAFVNAGLAWDVWAGNGSFSANPLPLRTVAVLYPNRMHVLVSSRSTTKTIDDLRGKRVVTGPIGSGTEAIALRIMAAHGLSVERGDFVQIKLSLNDSRIAFAKGEVDALFVGAPIPSPTVIEIARETPTRLLSHGHVVDQLNARYGKVYARGELSANTYSNQTDSVSSLDVWDMIVAVDGVPDWVVYKVAKTIFENKALLAKAHPAMTGLDFAAQDQFATVAMHVGSQAFFADKGIRPYSTRFRTR
jgi:uncharacterized protein